MPWFKQLIPRWNRGGTRSIRNKSAKRCLPAVEALEQRLVPTDYTVDRLGDAGQGTGGDEGDLRYVITRLNDQGQESNSIRFANNVSGVISLETALPAINKNVNIIGPGATALNVTRAGTAEFRIITINQDKQVVISALTMSNGRVSQSDGGAVLAMGMLTLTNVIIRDSYAARGGGIAASSNVTVTGSTIRDNTSVGKGGGVFFDAPERTATLDNSSIRYNVAQNMEGGGVFIARGTLILSGTNMVVRDNIAHLGAGVFNDTSGALQVVGATISNNVGVLAPNNPPYLTGPAYGGGIYNRGNLHVFSNSRILDHVLDSATIVQGFGAGIYLDQGTATIEGDTVISGNVAATSGGGIYQNEGTLTLGSATLEENRAFEGGGLYSGRGTTTINGTHFRGNRATNLNGNTGGGGAVLAGFNNAMTIDNAQFISNIANLGAAVFTRQRGVTIRNSNGTGNRSTQGGTAVRGDGVHGTVRLVNTNITSNAGDIPNLAAVFRIP